MRETSIAEVPRTIRTPGPGRSIRESQRCSPAAMKQTAVLGFMAAQPGAMRTMTWISAIQPRRTRDPSVTRNTPAPGVRKVHHRAEGVEDDELIVVRACSRP